MNLSRKILIFSSLLSLVVASLSAYFFYDFIVTKNKAEKDLMHATSALTQSTAESLNKIFSDLTKQVKVIADNITFKKTTIDQALGELKKLTFDTNCLYGTGIAWAPFEFEQKKLYAPYITCEQNKTKQYNIENFYDYTRSPWYLEAMEKKEGYWSEPFTDAVTGKLITRFAIPCFKFDPERRIQRAIAILFIDIPIVSIDQVTKRFIDSNIYNFVISKEGSIISHPVIEYITENKKISDVANISENLHLRDIANVVLKEKRGHFKKIDHDQTFLVFFELINSTGWVICFIQSSDPLKLEYYKISHTLIHLFILLSILSILLLVIIARAYLGQTLRLWIVSIWSSIAFLMVTIGVLILHYNSPTAQIGTEQTIINDNSSLNQFLNLNTIIRTRAGLAEETIFIPTGILIKSFNIDAKGQVIIGGYIWQNYDLAKHKNLEKGFLIDNAESTTIEKSYDVTKNNHEIIGWNFKCTLIKQFDYQDYPFDQQRITLVISHKSIEKNIVLIPDFKTLKEDYKLIGISKNLDHVELNFKQSYFAYSLGQYDKNLGIQSYTHQKNFPQLTFNIITNRKIIYPLVLVFLPILTITFLLFMMLFLLKYIINKPYTIISINSAIFFATILAQQRLKTIIPSNAISYSEYMYFLTYALISLTMLNSILALKGDTQNIITYKNNLVPRLLYWPLIMISILIITLFFFY